MVLVDYKILSGGLAMIIVGVIISLFLNSTMPIGTTGMTDDEAYELRLEQRESQDIQTLSGILAAMGFLLVLISFGARRKRRGGVKKVEKKPET